MFCAVLFLLSFVFNALKAQKTARDHTMAGDSSGPRPGSYKMGEEIPFPRRGFVEELPGDWALG